MSKKYDDYVNELKKETVKAYSFADKTYPMFPEKDKELDREIRDRAIISLVTASVKNGEELSYGDILLLIDNDSSEKEYEESKGRSGLNR